MYVPLLLLRLLVVLPPALGGPTHEDEAARLCVFVCLWVECV